MTLFRHNGEVHNDNTAYHDSNSRLSFACAVHPSVRACLLGPHTLDALAIEPVPTPKLTETPAKHLPVGCPSGPLPTDNVQWDFSALTRTTPASCDAGEHGSFCEFTCPDKFAKWGNAKCSNGKWEILEQTCGRCHWCDFQRIHAFLYQHLRPGTHTIWHSN